MQTTAFTPQRCRLTQNAASYAPETLVEASNAGNIYAVKPAQNGKVFVSTHADPIGHVCSYVYAKDLVYIDHNK